MHEQVLLPVVLEQVPQVQLAVARDLPRLRTELVRASPATSTLLRRAMPETMVKQDWTQAALLTLRNPADQVAGPRDPVLLELAPKEQRPATRATKMRPQAGMPAIRVRAFLR